MHSLIEIIIHQVKPLNCDFVLLKVGKLSCSEDSELVQYFKEKLLISIESLMLNIFIYYSSIFAGFFSHYMFE